MSKLVTQSVSAVILAAGKGRRAGSDSNNPKQFREILGIPLVAYSLKTFEKCEQIDEIIIAAPDSHIVRVEKITDRFGISKAKVIAGGKTRFESARLGFEKTKNDTEVVLFHDAARPFTDICHIAGAIGGALKSGAATAAIPLDDSIKKTRSSSGKPVSRYVEKTLARKEVWRVQTPQAFRRELLEGMYEKLPGNAGEFTDESALFERTGTEVIISGGNRRNMKITTEEDFVIAEAIAESIRRGKFKDVGE